MITGRYVITLRSTFARLMKLDTLLYLLCYELLVVHVHTLDKSSTLAVLEVTVSHWPFRDQFQHLADQNSIWSAKFPVHC